jgi:SAM-dependent methyltransferase
MDLETFNWLLTPDGQALLAEAVAGDLGDAARLRELERLRRLAGPARAAGAYEIAWARMRAAAKFSRAGAMYFTREALEQASGEAIASYRAARYGRSIERSYGALADLCCGAGGDTLALAEVAPVAAVDRDPLRLAMAAANARALGLDGRVTPVEADLERDPPPTAEAIFFDPARRSAGRRVFALAAYHPPVALVRGWQARTPAIGVKVAPGVADEELADLAVPEVEFISVDGELKEAVLWFGPLAAEGRRATVLLTNDRRPTTDDRRPIAANDTRYALRTTQHATPYSMLNAQPADQAPLAAPGSYLYEPDPAVIRARAVAALAEQLGAAQLDRQIAYLTADRALATPFARCWRVVEWLPFGLKRLRARLRELGAGAVTVKKRGSPLDTDALARQLSGAGTRPLVVVLTQVAGRAAALICEGPVGEG